MPKQTLKNSGILKMTRVTTTKKQKESKKKSLLEHIPSRNPGQHSKLASDTLLEYIKTGDLGSFRKVLASHIMNTNKVELARKSGLGRQTLYDLIDPNHNFDPALSTVAAVIRGLAQ
jgi:DNA-binding phage protein